MLLRSTLLQLLLAGALSATTLPQDFQEDIVRAELAQPSSFRFLPDGRILVSEQKTANLRLLIDGDFAQLDPLLTVPGVNGLGNERGLLSLEIDPAFPARPFVYVYYDSDLSGTDTRITRFTLGGDLSGSGDGELAIDPASALHVLTGIHDLRSNHNGGDLRFGIDGMLYLSTGDDEDSRCEAQQLDSLVGKILRLRVDHLGSARTGEVARAEIAPGDNPFDGQGEVQSLIHAYGLRNPVRFSIHPDDGTIFVCDVGKNDWEEISHVEIAGSNLGWPHREGNHVSDPVDVDLSLCPGDPVPFEWLPPIDEYSHEGRGALSIMGGEVYRAPPAAAGAWPLSYQGDVFYADYYEGWIRRLSGSGQSWSSTLFASGAAGGIVDMMVGPDHQFYYLSQYGGSLLRIRYTGSAASSKRSLGSLKALYGG